MSNLTCTYPSPPPSLPPSCSNYLGEANANIATLAMIETKEAIDNLEEICAVEGLDGVFIGTCPPSLPPSFPYAHTTLISVSSLASSLPPSLPLSLPSQALTISLFPLASPLPPTPPTRRSCV
jgi:hypothetical protein